MLESPKYLAVIPTYNETKTGPTCLRNLFVYATDAHALIALEGLRKVIAMAAKRD